MPWLVVTGTGSWSTVLGKEWVEPDNDLARGRWEYDAPIFRAGKHHVEQSVRDQAEEEGYPDFVFFFEEEDEPQLMEPDDTGILKPEDIRSGTRYGVHIQGPDDPEAEPVVDPEGLPLDFPCDSCERAFPSEGSRERHVEYDHTRRHEIQQKRAQREHERTQQEKTELRRLEDFEGPLPVWEREALEAQKPKPPPPK